MKRFLSLLCLLALWCVGGQASIFKPGTRATELKSGTYFIYNTTWVSGTDDYTGFYYSSGTAMKVSNGTKPSKFTTNDPGMFWTIEVVDSESGKCTMRNAAGLYVDGAGNLTATKSYIWITTYERGTDGHCGDDVSVEAADETTISLPSTTASENKKLGIWRIGDESKKTGWTGQGASAFNKAGAARPMALYPAKTTQYSITKIGDLSAPESLTVGSKVLLYNVYQKKYIYEGGYWNNTPTVDNIQSKTLTLTSSVCSSGQTAIYNTSVFEVCDGGDGTYTFKNVLTGNYIPALKQSASCEASSTAETFSLTFNAAGTSRDITDDAATLALKSTSSGLYMNYQGGNLVGWTAVAGGNSQYRVAEVEMTAADVDVVELIYDYALGDESKVSYPAYSKVLISPTSTYTYATPATCYGCTAPTAPTAAVVSASKTVTYVYTTDASVTLPFKTTELVDGKFPADTHWYRVKAYGYTAKYDATTNTTPESKSYTSNDFGCMFMISGDPVAGYKIQNLVAGPGKYLKLNSDAACSFTNEGSVFDYYDTKRLKAQGVTNGYLNSTNSHTQLGNWNNSAVSSDASSEMDFEEVTDLSGVVSFQGGGYEELDALIYGEKEYANGEAMPWYQCYNTSGVTIKNSKPAIVTSDLANSAIVATFPFEPTTITTNGEFAEGTKWYNMRVRGSKYCVTDAYDNVTYDITKSSTADQAYSSMYCFVKDASVDNGYKMYNRAVGAGASFYNSGSNNEVCTFKPEGSTLVVKTNGTSGFVFQLNGATTTHINDLLDGTNNNKLGVWVADGSATDAGSTFTFAEVSETDLEAAKTLPQPGKFYTIQSTANSEYLTPLKSEDVTTRVAMDDEAAEADRIFYFTGTHLLGYTNGLFLANNGDNMLSQAAVGNAGTDFYFRKQSDGVYNVVYNFGGRALYGAKGGYVDAAGSNQTGSDYQFTVTEVTDLPLTIGSNGWSTFSAPVAVTVPAGVTAYYAPDQPADGKLILKEIGASAVVPANTGIIVKGNTGDVVKFSTVTTGTEATVDNNKLVSNVVATSLTGESTDGKYAFATNKTSNVSGFMKLLTTITLPGHKCWLQTNTSSSSAQFVPIALADDPTGIESAETTTVSDSEAPIYDLQGRKVNGTKKGGMYIQNGKVFIAM